jgi:hypothetical protein
LGTSFAAQSKRHFSPIFEWNIVCLHTFPFISTRFRSSAFVPVHQHTFPFIVIPLISECINYKTPPLPFPPTITIVE